MSNAIAIQRARLRVAEQLVWVENHGSTEAGYIQRYGNSDLPFDEVANPIYGDGGQRIYAADMADLASRQEALDALLPAHPDRLTGSFTVRNGRIVHP